MKSFLTRLVSGIVLLAIIISTGIVGGPVLFGFTFLISLIGYWEFLKVFGLEKKLPGVSVWFSRCFITEPSTGRLPSTWRGRCFWWAF